MTNEQLDQEITGAFDRLVAEMNDLDVDTTLYRRPAYWEQYRRAHEVTTPLALGHKLLDWGAGVGHFGYVQSLLGADVTAYTVAIEGAGPDELTLREIVARAGIDHVSSPEPITLPFSDNTFDVVVSCGVLEHVREFGGDDQASLEEIARVLRPGGRFVCFHLPNNWSASEAVRRKLHRHHHAFTYSRQQFQSLAVNSGLEITTMYRYGMLPANSLAARLSGPTAKAAGRLDRTLSRVVGAIAQNHAFVCSQRRQ